MVMVRLRVSLQGMNVSQCNVPKSDGNKHVCVCGCVCVGVCVCVCVSGSLGQSIVMSRCKL